MLKKSSLFVFTLLFFLVFTTSIICQNGNYRYVVVSSALNLRAEPNKDSKVLATIQNGEMVESLSNSDDQWETIENLQGHWYRVKYKNVSGYAFSPYLGGRFMHFHENEHIGNLYFPKYKYWYGVYKTKNGDVLKGIKVKIVIKEEHKQLKTNNSDTSLFIIATNEKLDEKLIGIFKHTIDNNASPYIVPLKSNKVDQLIIKPKVVSPYHIFAEGIQKEGEYIENYKVFVGSSKPNQKKQNITKYLPKSPAWVDLKWVGDIDNDGKPDFILFGCTEGCSEVLFLSSEAKAGEFVRPVSTYSSWDDC